MTIQQFIPDFLDILYTADVRRLITLEEVRDAFHTNQILSKEHAVAGFRTLSPSNTLYVGSWIGFLTYCLKKEFPNIKFSELDIDHRCATFSKYFSQVPHYTCDIQYFNMLSEFDTVINLSCEHMDNRWFDRIKHGTNVLLQSNNLRIDDHVNCCDSIDEMKEKYNLTNITYSHTLELNVMNRYTLAGIK